MVDRDSRFENILHRLFGEDNNDRRDGLIIRIDNNTIYRFGVDGEDNINKFNAENLTILENVIDRFGLDNSDLKGAPTQKVDISLYSKATLETFVCENGDIDIKEGNYTIGES
ncbi:hypothetical protein [Mastigocoleus testarum]|uniref:Uncharacterized protein n=1 Tax=Mastigocoleus testarum BC008 TaxID=371196 RepID=A0A0V7ZD74_9CYAN|nr:hypothetical protein [Mastigocoleus testarum]KST62230.1 hypothetical protein BC008_08650 [Mastigocoleus testarum BC008]